MNMFEFNQHWKVQVLFGDKEVSADGPVAFGTPQIFVGPADGTASEAQVPLVYGPVAVRSHGNWVCIETRSIADDEGIPNDPDGGEPIHNDIHREMIFLSVEFDYFGHVRLDGYETRDDGVMIGAAWELSPFVPEDEPEASLEDAE